MSEMRRESAATGEGPATCIPHSVGGAFQLLLAANPLPMWVYDLETLRFLEVNDAAIVHYGYSRAAFLRMSIPDIHPDEDRARLHRTIAQRKDVLQRSGTWRHRRADGTLIEVEVTSHLLDWGGRPASLVVAHDVTETRRLHRELVRRALYDQATGLANAALFMDRTAAALARADEHGDVGIVVVGLSSLDTVVSTVGDAAGDALVAEVGRRLRSCCTTHETLARLGGGRFAVLSTTGDRHSILRLATSIAAALEEPVALVGVGELHVSPAVGVAVGEGDDDAASLLRDATSAMRHAAQRGGESFVVANAELRRAALEAFETEAALARALREGQLRLLYQPIVDLGDGKVVACEALVRWERPGVGLVEPEHFVPLAERNGSIVELGAWVIDHAIADAATWPRRTGLRLRVAINLTARQLHDEHLVERVAGACATSGLSPATLCVELTESAFVATDDYGAYRVLETLRGMGVEVAIDDFGTGYSALSYLKHLPVDVLKIDRGFVAGLGTDPADTLLVEAIITVAHGLGLRVVAEGVETTAQLELLRDLGCDAVQGYLLSRPTTRTALRAVFDTVMATGSPARERSQATRRTRGSRDRGAQGRSPSGTHSTTA
jgi:PAS domain S-box-containing protein/diguanylate cyclase (GGDEF)-like protein